VNNKYPQEQDQKSCAKKIRQEPLLGKKIDSIPGEENWRGVIHLKEVVVRL